MLSFSIVIPCYPPHFKFLDRLIKNINEFKIYEGYTIKEIIIAASETNLISISETSNYPIIIYSTSEKCYAGKNRNTGKSKATGNWIVFLDADDYYHPEKIFITYKAILEYPDIDCIVHSYKTGRVDDTFLKSINKFNIISNTNIFNATFPEGKWIESKDIPTNYNIRMLGGNIAVHHGMATVRSQSIIEYNETMRRGQDGYFCRQHVLQNKLILINAILMIYNPRY